MQQWTASGFSKEVTETALAALRPSSRKVYDAKWEAFVQWCKVNGHHHPEKLSQVHVTEFLNEKAKHVTPATIKGYITALSRRHKGIKIGGKRKRLSNLTSIKTWRKGLEQTRSKPRPRTPQWCLEVVLKALSKPPYYPVDRKQKGWRKFLTRRTIFLTAVTSARRASELHAIIHPPEFSGPHVRLYTNPDFLHKVDTEWHRNLPIVLPSLMDEKDLQLRKLCVRTALKDYTNATLMWRAASDSPDSQLFLCYGSKEKGQPVSKK